MECYICTTPFQVINAIVMASHNNKESDLYIVPQFNSAEDYANRAQKINCFRKVILVDTNKIDSYKKRKNVLLLYYGLIWNYLRAGYLTSQILVPDTVYSRIYISSKAIVGRIICLYYLRKYRDSEVCYFDDGEGSYDNTSLYQPKRIDAFLRRIIFGKRAVNMTDTIYLLAPEVFDEINPNNKYNVKRIPSWGEDNTLLDKINYVCNYTPEKAITHSVVFIDTLSHEVFDSKNAEEYEIMRNRICDLFEDNIIVKIHPRDKSHRDTTVYRYSDIPFEVVCANLDMTNTLFISLASSAVCMPKILFNVEASVLLLYRLFPTKNSDIIKRDDFYNAISAQYKKPGLFHIPNTMEELKCELQVLNEKVRALN